MVPQVWPPRLLVLECVENAYSGQGVLVASAVGQPLLHFKLSLSGGTFWSITTFKLQRVLLSPEGINASRVRDISTMQPDTTGNK